MRKRWWQRAAQPGPEAVPPDQPGPKGVPPDQPGPKGVPPDLLAWAQVVDVSRLSDKTVQEAEDYLRTYRHMMLQVSREAGLRLMAVLEAQVSPPPPVDAQPLDVLATVLAARRRQLGIG